jgi:hypothetical protein
MTADNRSRPRWAALSMRLQFQEFHCIDAKFVASRNLLAFDIPAGYKQ